MCRRTAVPLVALLSSAALAILMVVQTGLTCTDKVALPVPAGMAGMAGMPGMDMSGMSGPMSQSAMMVCPVVLALAIASACLASLAIVMLWLDPHRAVTQRALLRALSELPPLRTAGVVALAGGSAVGAMLWLERSGPPALPVCALLLALLVACAVALTLATIAAGCLAIALGRRLILAIVAAVALAQAARPPCPQRVAPCALAGHPVPLLAAGRGLRAPPSFVR